MAEKPAQFSPIDPQTDPYGYLGFAPNSDGSVTRINAGVPPNTTISSYDGDPNLLVKDISINKSKNTWARVFLPKNIEIQSNSKLPLLIFIHGGGFVVCSAATFFFDDFYTAFAITLGVMIVSVDYRLAPEHRLPVAYDDCRETLDLIRLSDDEWLTKYADLSKSFVMGNSSGANIAYNVGLTASFRADDLRPLNIRGLILHQPFVGGTKRTGSELRGIDDKLLPPCVTDVMWELALPEGVDRDHEFCNPAVNVKPGQFDKMKALGWKILVTGYRGDPLFDRQMELIRMLEAEDLPVVGKFQEGGCHGADIFYPDKLKALCEFVKEFMQSVIATD